MGKRGKPVGMIGFMYGPQRPCAICGGVADTLDHNHSTGIDTTRGYGPAAVSALRIASKLAKNQDAQLW